MLLSVRHLKNNNLCSIGNRNNKVVIDIVRRSISQYYSRHNSKDNNNNNNSTDPCVVWNHLCTFGKSRNVSSTNLHNSNSSMKLLALTTVWCSVTARAFSASSSAMPPLAEQRSKFDSPLISKVISYLDDSPDPFHCVQTSTQILEEAGFVKCDSNTIPEKGQFLPSFQTHSQNTYTE